MSSFRRAQPAGAANAKGSTTTSPASAIGGVHAANGSSLATSIAVSSSTVMSAGVPSNPPTSAFAVPGTRKWLDGQVLTSSGHPHLDSILGGGLPLGTMILLEEDCKGIHANTLAQLFTAEGIACHHTVFVTGHDGRRSAAAFLSSLPLNVSSDSRDAAAAAASKSTPNSNSSGLAGPGAAPDDDQHTDNADEIENLDGSDSADAAVSSTPDDAAGDGLKIAWQYKKYLPGQQQLPSAAPSPLPPASNGTASASPPPPPPRVTKYCHTFDLNRRTHADVLSSCGAVVLPSVDDVSDGEAAAMQLLRSASSAASSSAAGAIDAAQSQTRQTSAIKSALKGSSSSSSAVASSKGAGKRSSSRLPSNVAELVLLAQSRGLIDDDVSASAAGGGGAMTPAAAAMLLSNFIASRCSQSPDAAAVYGSLLEKIHDCCLGLPALHHPNRHQHVMQRRQLPSASSHGNTPRPSTPSRPITPGAGISTGGQLVATAAASIPGAARRSSFVGLHLPGASPPSTPGRPTVASSAVGTATVTSATSVDGTTTPVAVPALGSNRPMSVEGGASSVPFASSSSSARRPSAAGFGVSAATPVAPSPVAVDGSSGTPTTANSTVQPNNVTRITVLGCGGPLWPGWTGSDVHAMACVPGAAGLPDDKVFRQYRPLVTFISGLRRTIEIDNSGGPGAGSSTSTGGGAVVLVTMPTHSMPLSVAAHIRSHFDVVVKVHAFGDPAYALATNRATARQHLLPAMLAGAASITSSAASAGTDTAPEYRDYHGLLLIRRLARVGSLVSPSLPDTLTWVFKRDRKKMVIEKPHLPPELDDTRTADTTTSSASASATGAQAAAAAAGTAGGHAHAHDASCGCATGHGTNSNTTFTAAGGADGKVKFSNSVSVHVATRPSAADASAAVIRGVDSGAAASSVPGSKDTTRALKPAGAYPSHASAVGRATSSSNSGGLGAFMGSGLSHHQLDHVDPSRSRSGFAGLLDDEDDDEGSGGVVHSHRDRTSGYYGRQSAVVPPSVPAAVTHTLARAPPLEPGMACAAAAGGGSGRSRTGAAGGAAQGAAAAGTGSAAGGGGSLEF